MAYFNHAFNKMFLGTATTDFATDSAASVAATEKSYDISLDVKGTYRFTDCNFNVVNVASTDVTSGKPLFLISSSVLDDDKIGNFHGGYKETNKSKMINPKYISEIYKVVSKTPVNQIVSLGETSIGGTTPCFLCDQTYDIRIDIKGSPALRFVNHNVYENISFFTGCCDTDTPEATDPILAMIGFAEYIIADPILPKMIDVTFEASVDAGTTWTLYFAPGTALATRNAVLAARTAASTTAATLTDTWDNYTSTFTPATTANFLTGLVLESAFVETKFGDCTFQPCDFFERQPIQIYASLIDHEGNPCPTCANVTVTELQEASQGEGFGESVVRELILSESYRQNDFNTSKDSRVREVTQGYDILGSVDRNTLFTRYYIKHNVPRYNNQSSLFDNDQYLLCIVTTGSDAGLETFLTTWLTAANNPVSIKSY